ncbi:MAG: DUF952 domain-containing protein [Acidobacteriota bacterium]|nr:DUF952 domain-containing protein [Acidobacteriota bacterium]
MLIYHMVLPEVWEKFKGEDFYEAESLQTEGFIHCSFVEQIETVLNRYYKNTERVFLLEIETEKLTSELINEPSTGGEIYPHIYGKINKEAIAKTEERSM